MISTGNTDDKLFDLAGYYPEGVILYHDEEKKGRDVAIADPNLDQEKSKLPILLLSGLAAVLVGVFIYQRR
tara:strand:+ start:2109 stop:2321 length:213 start_codon:yes stop_codon:yes gene_type:complete